MHNASEQTVPMEVVREVDDGNESITQLKIEAVKANPQKVSPLIGYFITGFNPIKSPNQEPRVRVLKNVKRTNRLQLVVSPNGSPVEFVGTNYSGEAATPQMCTYALGVLDKQTNTLKIVQIEANKIFRLEPKLGESHLPGNAASDSLKEETAEEKAIKELKYRNKQSKREARKLEALRRHQDPEYQDNLDKKLKKIKINKEALEVAESTANSNGRNIPPHDMTTDNIAMVYPIHKIIFSGEWDYLYDIVEHLQAGRELEPDSYPTFVRNRVHILDEMKDEDAKSNLAAIFSYITHLIKFKDKFMDNFSAVINHKFPSILWQKFTTMFADSGSKKLAADKENLLISYVLVLTLIADKFETDPSDIAKDLRMNSDVALRQHFEYLGCTFKREKKVLLAMLKAPLQFPKINAKRRRTR